ncbi:MAG: hypothetical protein RLZZ127_2066, partial [Planctomycetota bacterium]
MHVRIIRYTWFMSYSRFMAVVLASIIIANGLHSSEGRGGDPILDHQDIVAGSTTSEGHRVLPGHQGARITCVMQDLEGHLTDEGLRIMSVDEGEAGSFAIKAATLGRAHDPVNVDFVGMKGRVSVDGSAARLVRNHGLVEEITTSSEGIRQDWLVHDRPPGTGPLELVLSLEGASASLGSGSQVDVSVSGGRRLTWHRLHVTDAQGAVLAARFQVDSPHRIGIIVDDADAAYPVTIDPTFTDADWISTGSWSGVAPDIFAIVPYGNGLVVAGSFTIAGNVSANRIAQWNGSSWSALGSGFDGEVLCLATSGTTLYAGGNFSTAGGKACSSVAKWDGAAWSPMGEGLDNTVNALAIIGSTVYAGGKFTVFASDDAAGAIGVARWTGSAWMPLGNGVGGTVESLCVVGSDLYVGGSFPKDG